MKHFQCLFIPFHCMQKNQSMLAKTLDDSEMHHKRAFPGSVTAVLLTIQQLL